MGGGAMAAAKLARRLTKETILRPPNSVKKDIKENADLARVCYRG